MSEIDVFDARLRSIEQAVSRIDERLAIKLESIEEKVKEHDVRIGCIESKSGKRWETLTAQIIAFIVAAIMGLLIGLATKFIGG